MIILAKGAKKVVASPRAAASTSAAFVSIRRGFGVRFKMRMSSPC
jgi:hypothetical protein